MPSMLLTSLSLSLSITDLSHTFVLLLLLNSHTHTLIHTRTDAHTLPFRSLTQTEIHTSVLLRNSRFDLQRLVRPIKINTSTSVRERESE